MHIFVLRLEYDNILFFREHFSLRLFMFELYQKLKLISNHNLNMLNNYLYSVTNLYAEILLSLYNGINTVLHTQILVYLFFIGNSDGH